VVAVNIGYQHKIRGSQAIRAGQPRRVNVNKFIAGLDHGTGVNHGCDFYRTRGSLKCLGLRIRLGVQHTRAHTQCSDYQGQLLHCSSKFPQNPISHHVNDKTTQPRLNYSKPRNCIRKPNCSWRIARNITLDTTESAGARDQADLSRQSAETDTGAMILFRGSMRSQSIDPIKKITPDTRIGNFQFPVF
jgi:hypothetical protein